MTESYSSLKLALVEDFRESPDASAGSNSFHPAQAYYAPWARPVAHFVVRQT